MRKKKRCVNVIRYLLIITLVSMSFVTVFGCTPSAETVLENVDGYIMDGDFEKAEKQLLAVIEKTPDDVELKKKISEVYRAQAITMNSVPDALEYFQKSQEYDTEFEYTAEELNFLMQTAINTTDKMEEVLEICEKSKEGNETLELSNELCGTLLKKIIQNTDSVNASIGYIERLKKLDPWNAEAYLADIFATQNVKYTGLECFAINIDLSKEDIVDKVQAQGGQYAVARYGIKDRSDGGVYHTGDFEVKSDESIVAVYNNENQMIYSDWVNFEEWDMLEELDPGTAVGSYRSAHYTYYDNGVLQSISCEKGTLKDWWNYDWIKVSLANKEQKIIEENTSVVVFDNGKEIFWELYPSNVIEVSYEKIMEASPYAVCERDAGLVYRIKVGDSIEYVEYYDEYGLYDGYEYYEYGELTEKLSYVKESYEDGKVMLRVPVYMNKRGQNYIGAVPVYRHMCKMVWSPTDLEELYFGQNGDGYLEVYYFEQ